MNRTKVLLLVVSLVSMSSLAYAWRVETHKTKTVPEWIVELQSARADRALAIRCRMGYGAEAETAIPALRSHFNDEDSEIGKLSKNAVTRIFSEAHQDTVSQLSEDAWVHSLENGSNAVLAAYALSRIATGKSLATLTVALQNKDVLVVHLSAEGIKRIIQSAEYGKDNLSGQQKRDAVTAIRRRQAGICLDALRKLARSDDSFLAGIAIDALGAFGGYHDGIVVPAVPDIAAGLQVKDRSVKFQAARALGRIGRDAATVVTELVMCASQEERRDRASDRFSGGSPNGVRRLCLQALGSIGPASRDALPLIVRALTDHDEEIRSTATSSLELIGVVPEAIPILVANLADPSPVVRHRTAVALARSGKAAPVAIPVLTKALADKDWMVRFCAAMALRDLSEHASNSLSALRECLNDENRTVRAIAQEAIVAIEKARGRNGPNEEPKATDGPAP